MEMSCLKMHCSTHMNFIIETLRDTISWNFFSTVFYGSIVQSNVTLNGIHGQKSLENMK